MPKMPTGASHHSDVRKPVAVIQVQLRIAQNQRCSGLAVRKKVCGRMCAPFAERHQL